MLIALLAFLLDVPLVREAPLRVLDQQGRPVAGARVEALPCTSGRPGRPLWQLETGEDGGIGAPFPRLDCLVLVVDHSEHAPLVAVLDSAFPSDLRLRREERLAGTATDTGGLAARQGRACASWETTLPELGRPLAWQRCAELDDAGHFEIWGLPRTELSLAVSARGFPVTKTRSSAGMPIIVRLAAGVPLSGLVTDFGRRPIAGALVRAADGETKTSDLGTFDLAVPSLPATLHVEAEGYHAQDLPVTQVSARGLRIQLAAGEDVTGALLGPQSQPVTKAVLLLEQQVPGGRYSLRQFPFTADGEGRFRVALPGAGEYRVRIRAEGFREASVGVIAVAEHTTHRLGVVGLEPGAGVGGRLVDAVTGGPVPGAALELMPQGGAILEAWMRGGTQRGVTAADGGFHLDAGSGGRYELRIQRSGYATHALPIRVWADRVEDLGEIAFGPGVDVSGTVTQHGGAEERSPGNVQVRFFDREGSDWLPILEAATDSRGKFGPLRVAPGEYLVKVVGQRLLLAEHVEIEADSERQELELKVAMVKLRGAIHRRGVPFGPGQLVVISALDPSSKRGKVQMDFADRNGRTVQSELFNTTESRLAAAVGANGSFELTQAPTGQVRVAFIGDGAQPIVRELVILEQEEPAFVAIDIGGLALDGRLFDVRGGHGLAGSVELLSESGEVMATTQAEDTGEFLFVDVTPGVYSVRARVDGYGLAGVENVRVSEEAPRIAVGLEPTKGCDLTVRLTRRDGSSLSRALVTVLDRAGAMVGSLPTNPSGERTFKGLPAEPYTVVWSDVASGTGFARVRLEDGKETVVERVLDDGATAVVLCEPDFCGDEAVGHLSLSSDRGPELQPFLSGLSTSLRFSPEGVLVLGRLAPGEYSLDLAVGKLRWRKSFQAEGDQVVVAIP